MPEVSKRLHLDTTFDDIESVKRACADFRGIFQARGVDDAREVVPHRGDLAGHRAGDVEDQDQVDLGRRRRPGNQQDTRKSDRGAGSHGPIVSP